MQGRFQKSDKKCKEYTPSCPVAARIIPVNRKAKMEKNGKGKKLLVIA